MGEGSLEEVSREMSQKKKGLGITREECREGHSRNWEQRVRGPGGMRHHILCWGSQVIQDGLWENL